MDKNQTDEPRRRVSAEGVRVSREALHLVRPINEKLGGWQAESIRLETTARRMKESGRHDPGVIESIRTLLGYVEEQSRQFDELVAAAPADVARHSRVADTRRVLQMVAERLRPLL